VNSLDVLRFIAERVETHGSPPTYAEVREAFGFRSDRAAAHHFQKLEEQGYITRRGRVSRGIEFTAKGRQEVSRAGLPIIGRIVAGLPVVADEVLEGHLPLGELERDGDFILRVRGDSLIGAGIRDGDYVLLREQSTADRGDIVAVIIEEYDAEATLKGYFPEKDHVKFVAANPKYEPIAISYRSAKRWRIIGKVTGVVRRGAVRMRENGVA
jgi:repressor LexA